MFCPILRGSFRLALAISAYLLSAAGLAAQAPQGRILNTFDLPQFTTAPFLESGNMVVSAEWHYNDDWDARRYEWLKVKFWDKDGSNYSERILPEGLVADRAGTKSMVEGDDLFLENGGTFDVVNRNPAVPIRGTGGIWTHDLCDVTDRYLIVRTEHAQDWDGIKFHDRQTFKRIGRVETSLRVQQLKGRENDIVFSSRDSRGKFRLHRMGYPDFTRRDVVKMKIAALPGAWDWVSFFGEEFALVTLNGNGFIIRYTDPLRNGKSGVYPVPRDSPWGNWAEAGDTLLNWASYRDVSLHHIEFSAAGARRVPVGLPPGLRNYSIVSSGLDSIYLRAPTPYTESSNFTWSNWIHRLDISAGRQLTFNNPVADERDGKIRFTARLDTPAASPVTIGYETAGHSAVSGTDFTASSGTVVIPAGQHEAYIDVPLIEDFTIESPETLELKITSLAGATCEPSSSYGRIRGSGARLLEVVKEDAGGSVVSALDGTTARAGAVRKFTIGAVTVDARMHGFDCFWPAPDAGDGFRYARALPHGSEVMHMKICQFHGTTGELLEVFDFAPFSAGGGKLTLGYGEGYVRYGFFDDLPVLALDGLPVAEGPAAKEIVTRAERTLQPLDITAEWSDPASTLGDASFEHLPSGDVVFRLSGGQEQSQIYDFTTHLATTVSVSGAPVPSSRLTPVTITEDLHEQLTFVPAETDNASTIAASGNRLWTGEEYGLSLESFVFEGGVLTPGPKLALGAGTILRPKIDTLGYNKDFAIAFDGERVFAASVKSTGEGFTVVSGANTTKPKAKLVPTRSGLIAQATGGGFVASSYRVSSSEGFVRFVELRSAKNNKVVAIIRPVFDSGLFGFSLAITDNVLWVGSPIYEGGGKVLGYELGRFTQVVSLESSSPVERGFFGYSLAAHGPYVVVGEASSIAPGAAWVYSADGRNQIARLGSGLGGGWDGFATRVATRSGRILVGSGQLEGLSDFEREDTIGHRPVMLWNSVDAPAIRLQSSFDASSMHDTGVAIALLDDAAVIYSRSRSDGSAGFEYVALPSPAASDISQPKSGK